MRLLFLALFLFLAGPECRAQDSEDNSYLRGVEHAVRGDFEKADKEFEYALLENPFLIYASSCRKIATDAIAKKIKHQTAVSIFRGIDYSNREMWREALAEFGKAIAEEPDCPYIYNERGISYDLCGENDKAIADFTRSIALEPGNEYAYNNRGHAYVLADKYDEAMADFRKAVELNPYYAIAHYNLGWIYSVHKLRYDDAVASFTAAIKLNPKFDDAYIDRGFAYFSKSKYDEALSDFNKAASVNPKNTRAHWNKAVLLDKMGRKDEAVSAYLGVIENAPPGSEYIEEARLKIQGMKK